MNYVEEFNEVLDRMRKTNNDVDMSDFDKFCTIASDSDHIARLCDQRLEEIENGN